MYYFIDFADIDQPLHRPFHVTHSLALPVVSLLFLEGGSCSLSLLDRHAIYRPWYRKYGKGFFMTGRWVQIGLKVVTRDAKTPARTQCMVGSLLHNGIPVTQSGTCERSEKNGESEQNEGTPNLVTFCRAWAWGLSQLRYYVGQI